MITWVDGVPAGCVPADDRGLAYGDGLFETMAVERGSIRLLDRHLERAALGCRRLGFPPVDWLAVRDHVGALLAAESGLARSAVARLTVTRGSGGAGYRPGEGPPRSVLSLRERPPPTPGPVRVRWCRTAVISHPQLAGIKHLNRLPQVLARAEWSDETVFEGLMCDQQGHVACGTMTNVFVVTEGHLRTPDLSQAGVAGIMRACVLEAAADIGIDTAVVTLTPRDLHGADEVFVTNAVRGLVPVAELAGHTYRAPGPVSASISRWLEARRWPC
jgi:4-amino-4-deoxychorismate lyase